MAITIRSSGVLFFVSVLLSYGLGTSHALALAPQPLPVSKGVYRLPYADGTSVSFSNDHTNHPTTLNRVDMTGQGGGPYTVVAAGAGVIRIIVETNDTTCPDACGPDNDCDDDGTVDNNQAQISACNGYSGSALNCCERDFEANGGTCPGGGTCQGGPNNFVWIEHPNGEWSKYTHLRRGSVGSGTDNSGNPGAGRSQGDSVNAGDPIGIQGDVGIASGPHVHFEVAVPNYVELAPPNTLFLDPDSPPATVNDWFSGGFLVGDGIMDDVIFEDKDGDGANDPDDDVNRQNRIAVFCQIGIPVDNDNNTAGRCDDLCNNPISDFSGTTIAAGVVFQNQTATVMGNPNGDFVAETDSGVSIRAGERITLSPGFHAELNSFFSASIGACDAPGGTGE